MTSVSKLLAGDLAPARIPDFEPEPDIAGGAILRSIVGIRPFRHGGFRIEHERIGGKNVIHNYGHGGAGVTLSWGSATEVVRLAQQHSPNAKTVCVIGGGVIGLTSAILLSRSGMAVRIVSENYTPRTTSDIAGAQWAPSLVDAGEGAARKELFARVQRESFKQFQLLDAEKYGVSVRPNYVEADHDTSFYKIPDDILPKPQILTALPFKSRPVPGRVFTTLFIQPPIFMPRLMQDCRDLSIALEQGKLESSQSLQQIPDDLIVNCTGFGAAKLVNDDLLVPIRGQLVLAKPQNLPWLLSHKNGYIFPRNDAVVMGGTVEHGISEILNTEEGVDKILRGNRGFFQHG